MTEKINIKKMEFKTDDYASGVYIGYDKNKKLDFAAWGTPKQLACLYLDLQDRLPEGIVEYANMIRSNLQDEFEPDSLASKAQTNYRIN